MGLEPSGVNSGGGVGAIKFTESGAWFSKQDMCVVFDTGQGSHPASDSSSVVVPNPEALGNGFGLKRGEDARDDGRHRVPVLTRQLRNNDSGVIFGRPVLGVGEGLIQRKEDALRGLPQPGHEAGGNAGC